MCTITKKEHIKRATVIEENMWFTIKHMVTEEHDDDARMSVETLQFMSILG